MPFKTVWTTEMENELKRLDEEKLSFGEISKIMSQKFRRTPLTRNSCIGKAHRMGLALRGKPVAVPKIEKPKPKPRSVTSLPDVAPLAPREPRSGGITIYELRDGDCRMPLAKLDDSPPYMYCGDPALVGQSWCIKCREIVIRAPGSVS